MRHLGKVYKENDFNIDWIKQYLINVTVIVDVGSYDGSDSLRLALGCPRSIVYSIEAAPKNFEILKEISLLASNLQVFQCALGEKTGEVEFYLRKNSLRNKIMGGLYPISKKVTKLVPHVLKGEKIIVNGFTWDDFCEKYSIAKVDLMLADVEGAGLQLLKGMNTVFPKMIFIEKEYPEYFIKNKKTGDRELLLELNKKGYKLIKELRNDYLLIR